MNNLHHLILALFISIVAAHASPPNSGNYLLVCKNSMKNKEYVYEHDASDIDALLSKRLDAENIKKGTDIYVELLDEIEFDYESKHTFSSLKTLASEVYISILVLDRSKMGKLLRTMGLLDIFPFSQFLKNRMKDDVISKEISIIQDIRDGRIHLHEGVLKNRHRHIIAPNGRHTELVDEEDFYDELREIKDSAFGFSWDDLDFSRAVTFKLENEAGSAYVRVLSEQYCNNHPSECEGNAAIIETEILECDEEKRKKLIIDLNKELVNISDQELLSLVELVISEDESGLIEKLQAYQQQKILKEYQKHFLIKHEDL